MIDTCRTCYKTVGAKQTGRATMWSIFKHWIQAHDMTCLYLMHTSIRLGTASASDNLLKTKSLVEESAMHNAALPRDTSLERLSATTPNSMDSPAHRTRSRPTLLSTDVHTYTYDTTASNSATVNAKRQTTLRAKTCTSILVEQILQKIQIDSVFREVMEPLCEPLSEGSTGASTELAMNWISFTDQGSTS